MSSRVLDEFIIQEVARTCPEPFIGYHKCIEDPTIPDKSACATYQRALQQCVKTQVTVYRDIESSCSSIINKYQSCIMKDNDGNSSSKCFNELKDLRDCALNIIDSAHSKNSSK